MTKNTVKIDTETKLCAVIGNPVKHSLSPAMHNAAFQAVNLNYAYLAFCVENVKGCLDGMRALPTFRGMSVTIPHKLTVMEHLDEIDPLAQHVGCVNTITNENGRLIGTITDGLGTVRAFENAGVSLRGKNILCLGAGGAVRAVAYAFAEICAPQSITILGRTPAKVDALVNDLRESAQAQINPGYLPGHLYKALLENEIIVQGTPLGMYGHGEGQTGIPRGWLRPHHVVFDMVYRPLKTRLIQDAEEAGCKTVLGLEMLLEQAVLQFERWTGKAAPREIMRNALLAELNKGIEVSVGSQATA